MNIKRSYLQLLLGSVTVGLFLANCTVQQAKDDGSCDKGDVQNGCPCADGSVGHQACTSDGVFGACICPDPNSGGASNTGTAGKTSSTTAGETSTTTGGKSGTGGTTYAGSDAGGSPVVDPAAGGAGGDASVATEDCDDCLMRLCKTEWDACFADSQCISENIDGTGQYENISRCINVERVNGLVKRDVVRNCGVTIGASATDATLADAWAPRGMAPTTTNLLNCLATSPKESPNADWANSDANFPVVKDMVVPTPWPNDSCAKLACTGKI